MRQVHAAGLILWFLLIPGFSGATTYYVHAEDGNDLSDGTSPTLAWKSLEKVSLFLYQPGDSVLFHRGSHWHGMLSITKSGKSGQPLVFSAYGQGDKPGIHGDGLVQAAVFIHNSASYISVANLAITNYDSLDIYDGAEGLRSGIQVGEWLGDMSEIYLVDNEIYFIEGCSNHSSVGPPRGTSLNPDIYNHYQNAGIFIHAAFIDTLVIEGNYVHDCTCTGIFPFLFEEATSLLIQHNSIFNVGGDGIVILHAKSPLIQLNSVILAGNNSGAQPREPGQLGLNGLAVAGIWSSICSDPLFQFNYCEGTKRIVWDGQPWDFDIETTGNAIYQYNYSRDNEGGFNLGGEPHQLFRYNISYNDGSRQGNDQYFFNGQPTYYNNTFYRDDSAGFLLNEWEKQTFINNIFYTNSGLEHTYQSDSSVFSHNGYFGHYPNSPGAFPVTGNPVFANPASPGKILPGIKFSKADLRQAVLGLTITSGSDCINTGLALPENGGMDFWGNVLYENEPDIGACEYSMASDLPFENGPGFTSNFVFPNPASTELTFRTNPGPGSFYTIFNFCGQPVLEGQITHQTSPIDISMLTPGWHLIECRCKDMPPVKSAFVKISD